MNSSLRIGLVVTSLIVGMAVKDGVASADNSSATAPTPKAKHRKKASHDSQADAELAPDNTGVNKRDRKDGELTADQQKNDKTDLELTAKIRRSIVEDKDLSTDAHNVKIIARDGKITLKGPVASSAEKKVVEEKAAKLAGPGNVTSEVEVKP